MKIKFQRRVNSNSQINISFDKFNKVFIEIVTEVNTQQINLLLYHACSEIKEENPLNNLFLNQKIFPRFNKVYDMLNSTHISQGSQSFVHIMLRYNLKSSEKNLIITSDVISKRVY